MDLGIGGIAELARLKPSGIGLKQLIRRHNGALHALATRRQDQLGPKSFQQFPSFDAHGLRHGQDQSITPRGRNHRQGDTGIAAGGLDKSVSRLDFARALGVIHHGCANTVFHARHGVEAFQFRDDLARQQSVDAAQVQQGCLPDQVGDVFVDAAHVLLLNRLDIEIAGYLNFTFVAVSTLLEEADAFLQSLE